VRTTLSTALYIIDVCVKLFNMASPKFDERGGTTCNRLRLPKGYVR
jgi:hypothetical protein